MLTLEMIKRLNEEDREFWLNECSNKELEGVIVSWRDIKTKQSIGYVRKEVLKNKQTLIDFINKIITFEKQEADNEYFEDVKKQVEPNVAIQLSKGDKIEDVKLKLFFYELVEGYYECGDNNFKSAIISWRRLFEGGYELAHKYYKGLIRFFHSDTSDHSDTELFNMIRDSFKYVKEEVEYNKVLAKQYEEEFGIEED